MNAPQPADSSAPAAASNDRFSSGSVPRSGIDLIIPFYRNAELVGPLYESLAACGAELHELNAAVVAINDSPEHEPLAQALREASARLGKEIPVSIIDNTVNLGFVRSCNRGLSKAATANRDAVLLNSDTIVFPGAFREMVRVARLDPMIGFVSPRSNNVTIASPPVQQDYCHQAPPEAYASFQCLSDHLPDYHYAPTGVGFCLLVKHTILREFGLLDEAYGAGYNEESDLVMRANRCGYRAVLANKAFVYHHGEKSFAVGRRAELEKRNGCLLANRYPEYPRAVRAYCSGPIHTVEQMLSGLLPGAAGRQDLVFDFSDLGSYHNGTIEAANALIRQFAAQPGRFNLFVVMHAEHARFHGLDRMPGLHVLPVDTDRTFAVGLRVGQPFTLESLARFKRLAVRTAWFMLDTITWDCLYLTNPELDWIWSQVFEHADAVIYNSEFTREQFARRFPEAAAVRHLVSPHSLDPAEYLPPGRRPGLSGEHILVVGNKFAHKHVGPAVDALVRGFPNERIECVGLASHPHPLVSCHDGGHVTPDVMESLYEQARLVVFPSHYEGFGFPVLKALAYGKPILARDCDLARGLKASLVDDPRIVLFETTNDLVAAARTAATAVPAPGRNGRRRGWAESQAEIADLLEVLAAGIDPFPALVRRMTEPPRVHAEPVPEVDPALPPILQRTRSYYREHFVVDFSDRNVSCKPEAPARDICEDVRPHAGRRCPGAQAPCPDAATTFDPPDGQTTRVRRQGLRSGKAGFCGLLCRCLTAGPSGDDAAARGLRPGGHSSLTERASVHRPVPRWRFGLAWDRGVWGACQAVGPRFKCQLLDAPGSMW